MAAINNVTRLLESRNIRYVAFELPGEKLSAIETAKQLGINPSEVFKTIVVMRDISKRPMLVLVPATANVDLKQVAAFLNEKRVHLPTERQAEILTGLQAGGISPLALLHKAFPVLIDISALKHAEINVSGGQRGLNIRMRLTDLAEITKASFAPVSRPEADDRPGVGQDFTL